VALEVFDARTDVRNVFITPEIRARIMRFDAGQASEGHTHDVAHEMFLVLEGHAEFTIAGQSAVLGPGQGCVARAGEWHELKAVGDQPMTMYLSVTPHVEPTHTMWDHEGGSRQPYRYGNSTGATTSRSSGVLIQDHLDASQALADAAQQYLTAQRESATRLQTALSSGDQAAVQTSVEDMTAALQSVLARLRESELVWNELTPAITAE
jgi:quercetin dioxygenase-like cupin family protein